MSTVVEKQISETESDKMNVSKSSSNIGKTLMEGPDRGWAWAVAFASCMINFIMAGLGRMSGILFVAFIEIFGVDRKSASMPFSVKSSTRNLFGPVVGILGQKYGARKIIIAGGIVGTIGSAACFFTPDVMWITVLWGGVYGLGSALTVTLPQVVIGQYFDKHRTTASGIAFSGGCVGSFVFPVLLEYLLQNYGIEGTFLIVGAIIMHTIPAALILKKPSWLSNGTVQKKDDGKQILAESLDNLEKEEGNDVIDSKTEVTSVNECTPSRFTPKMTKSDGSENGIIFTSVSRMSVRSINECTPKRRTPKRTLRNSNVYPDLKLLQEYSDLTVKILNDGNNNSKTSIELNPDFCFMNEIESLCASLRHSQNESRFCNNLRHARTKLFVAAEKDYLKVASDQMFYPKKRLPEIAVSKLHSLLDISKSANTESRAYVLDKLSLLEELDERQIVANCLEEANQIELVLTELRKLNKLCPRIDNKAVISEEKQSASPKNSELDKADSNSFLDHIKTAFMLYLNPLFLMVCLCRAVHFITFIPAMTTVVDFCMDKGLPEDDGKFAIAAISVGDLLGRLCFGWVTDRGFMTLPKYMMVVMVLQGISTASLPMMNTKMTIFSTLALFGMLQGSLFVRHPVLISNYMRADAQSIAMGCVNFFSGLLGFGLPLYIGYFRDTIGSYDYIFCINGALGACVGLLWAFEPVFTRYVNSRQPKHKTIV